MLSSFTTAQFINVASWQGEDVEPTYNSRNIPVSSGVYNFFRDTNKSVQNTNRKISRAVLSSEFIDSVNVYKVVDSVLVLMENANWAHRLVPIEAISYITVYCTTARGANGNYIPGIIFLSSENIADYISCEYAEGTISNIYRKDVIANIPSNATHAIIQTRKASLTSDDYCGVFYDFASLKEDVEDVEQEVNLIEDNLIKNIKTKDLLSIDNVYQIVDGVPTLFETTSWRRQILKLSAIRSISVWCSSEAGTGTGKKIPGIIYLSDNNIESYISCEYSVETGGSAYNLTELKSIPANAKYCILQTGISFTSDSDMCSAFTDIDSLQENISGLKTDVNNLQEDVNNLQEDVNNLQEDVEEIQGLNKKTLIVDKSGDEGTYLTLSSAMQDANSGDTILIYDGIYEENHIYLKRDVKIIGIGFVEIRGYLPTSTENFASKVTSYSTLEAENGCDLENLTITARNLRYPIHAQSSPNTKSVEWKVKNCKFIHYGNAEAYTYLGSYTFRAISAWGCGANGGDKIHLSGCTFISNMRSMSIHNYTDQNIKSTESKGSLYALIENCTFISNGLDQDGVKHPFNDVIHIHALDSKTPDEILFNGCKANGYLVWQLDASYIDAPSLKVYISGTQGMKTAFNTYGGVSNSFTDLTSRAANNLGYYPKVNDEMEDWTNTGSVTIPRGYCVAKSSNYGIKMWDNTCTIDDFVGIALDEIPVNGSGNIKVKNYIHKIYAGFAYDAVMSAGDSIYIDSNGKPTLTQTSFEIGKVFDTLGNILIKTN